MRTEKKNLVVQLQLHNEKALETLLKEQGDRLSSIIREHLFTLPHLQQDCLIDTILTIWNQIECFDSENEFENWIGSVARFCCLECLKLHKEEATIAWLIEKEIAEEKEMMESCLNSRDRELLQGFMESSLSARSRSKDLAYRNVYELLNRIDTDIYEYEKQPLSDAEREEIWRRLQELIKKPKNRISFGRYLQSLFRSMERKQEEAEVIKKAVSLH